MDRWGELDGWLTMGPVTGFCEHCNEPSTSIKKADRCLTS